jgi:hypothetical protein
MVGVETTSNRSKGAGQLMIAIVLIGLAAGCASALMFASTMSGMPISLLLSLLAPLPLMVAALGWGPLGATIGGIAAASGFGVIFGLRYCVAFAIAVALPAWWLGHLALLGRPLSNASPGNGSALPAPQLEWYPVGRILLWIAGFAILSSVTSWLVFGKGEDAMTEALRSALLKVLPPREGLSAGDIEQLVDALMTILRGLAAMFVVTTLALNLWLAAKIAAVSGMLHRPWPNLKSTTLPPMTLVALSVALAFCFTGGTFGILAQIVAAALMMAYALVGLAVLHTVTLALKSRPVWLSCAYVILVLLPWSVILMIALGLADAVLGIRQRYLRSKPPPLPAS